ncbi:MAG: class II fructose-bisphosphate aldolase [Lachnospiraceae bacterium]|nr:class II fructose-bisphosphate aldolase [Lachnospiraceae bacterium]
MLVNLNAVLKPAQKEHYAVGLFNAVNLEMTNAIMNAAERLNAPVIMGTAEILLCAADLAQCAAMVKTRAEKSSVPVVLHYDHGLTFDKCIEAMDLGFTSIMYDCSTLSYEENVSRVAEMVKIAHEKDVTVEGELGHVGDNEGAGKLAKPSDYYTDPAQAADFVARTGVDALAVAVGNAHGDYAFPPKLDFERITQITEAVDVPLVLHGGSGLSEDDFREAIRRGIAKVNIFTDISKAQMKGIQEGITAGITNAFDLTPYEVSAIESVVEQKIRLFGSDFHFG